VHSFGLVPLALVILLAGCSAAPTASGSEDAPADAAAQGYSLSSGCGDLISERSARRSAILEAVFPDAEPDVRDAVLEGCRAGSGLTLGEAFEAAQAGVEADAAEAARWSGLSRTLTSLGTVPANQPYDGYTLAVELDLGGPAVVTEPGTALDTTEITLRWEGTISVRNATPSREFPEVGVKTLYLVAAYPVASPACTGSSAMRVADHCIVDVTGAVLAVGGIGGFLPADAEVSAEFGGVNAGGLVVTVPDADLDATLETLRSPLALGLTWTLETIEFAAVCEAPRVPGSTFGSNLLLGTVPAGNEVLFC
jgi:hypothetical protein